MILDLNDRWLIARVYRCCVFCVSGQDGRAMGLGDDEIWTKSEYEA